MLRSRASRLGRTTAPLLAVAAVEPGLGRRLAGPADPVVTCSSAISRSPSGLAPQHQRYSKLAALLFPHDVSIQPLLCASNVCASTEGNVAGVALRLGRWHLNEMFVKIAGRADARDAEIGRLKAKVGDLTMANELLEAKIERLETSRPLAPRRSRR